MDQALTGLQRFGLKTFTNADNRDVIYDFLTHLHTHRIDFHTSLRHLSYFRPSSPESSQSEFLDNLLRASLANPTDSQVEDAKKDFGPYLTRLTGRLNQESEVAAWTQASVADEEKGVKLSGDGWEAKREADMLRHNPKFVLRQWVLEELIAKLEETGVERIEEGRKALAKILDVGSSPSQELKARRHAD